VLQLDSSKINSDYLTFLLTSKDKIRYYATKTEGTLVERMAVKVDVFLNFQIEIEEDNENQKTVSEVLTTLIREISLLKKQLEQYKLQKKGLMQKLLTGEWRVR
jgi:type I restriction enzyme S subunit